jgi:hypothetical protein
MRTRISLAAAAIAAGVWTSSALPASPAQIYNDYVQRGTLRCSYAPGDLQGLLRSGSINQYGDPLTLARLKLAARRHLSGGCRTLGGSGSTPTGAGGGGGTPSTQAKRPGRRSKRHEKSPLLAPSRPVDKAKPSASGSNASFVAGRALTVGLLAVALAFAGWLTKRGLSARS